MFIRELKYDFLLTPGGDSHVSGLNGLILKKINKILI